MKIIDLKKLGIKHESVDNGYQVPKTHRFTKDDSKLVIDVDKEDYFGLKSYVISVNDELLTFYNGKVLNWDTMEDALDDVAKIFDGKFPTKFYTTCFD